MTSPSACAGPLQVCFRPISKRHRLAISCRNVYGWHSPRASTSRSSRATLSDRKLGVIATARNWTTVTTLLEMPATDVRSSPAHPYTVVDVFTDTPLAGNQLAVFTEGEAVPAG